MASSFHNATIERSDRDGRRGAGGAGLRFQLGEPALTERIARYRCAWCAETSSAQTTELPEDLTVTNAADTTCE